MPPSRHPLLFASLWLLSLAAAPLSRAQNSRVTEGVTHTLFKPSAINPESDPHFDEPHWVYVQRDIVVKHDASLPADRHELLLFIPGTQPPNLKEPEPGKVRVYASHAFCLTAASLGYHVISLSYPNTISASSCNKEADPEAFEKFRLSIIQGGASPHVTVSRTNSIENRLIELLAVLAKRFPQEDWGAYRNADGSPKWEKIAVAGQSQGGGHAALIGIHHQVPRVLCFGAPKDYSIALQKPAAWYLKSGATPKSAYFAFNHDQDRQGCTPAAQIENLKALRLDQFGAPTYVDGASAPYGGAHILMTNYPGTKVDSSTAHGTMLSPKNKERFGDVWKYMLTAETKK
ncbi:BPSS1187 family protein [Prosthecobacter sp.]|uniref:BPSS1187 family protein n=1 Tax=Prosthecobacter sp. TaxID=1965333 RepID=UPI0037846CF7